MGGHAVHLGRFDEGGPKACLRHDDRALDLSRVEPDATPDLLAMLGDRDIKRRLSLLERGQPPQDARRHADKLAWMAPIQPQRMLLRGGVTDDIAPSVVLGHGAKMPAGPWSTGVACVVGANKKPAGFTVFQRVGDTVAIGPWLVTADAVGDPLGLIFSAFVDDAPTIRPVKALLDWQGEIDRAEPKLAAGDMVCLAAPPQDASGDLRAAMANGDGVLCRLETEAV